eukprot:1918596-Lingulodinium_polyedra.AAC.1
MNVIDKGILDSRCRLAGEDRGLELWHSMVVDHESHSTTAMMRKQKAFQYPRKCPNLRELTRVLPFWLQLEKEIEAWSPPGDRVKQAALHVLIPDSLLTDLRRDTHLQTYADQLAWVKTQCQFDKEDDLVGALKDDPMMIGYVGEEKGAEDCGGAQPMQDDSRLTEQQLILNALQEVRDGLNAVKGKGSPKGGAAQKGGFNRQPKGGGKGAG